MMDNSSTDPLPSEHTCNEVNLKFEGGDMKEVGYGDVGDPYHDQYYLERFLHAFKEHNQGSQRWLQHRFRAVVLDWVRGHPRRDLACHLHSEEYYVIQTFKRCWQSSLHYQKFEFESLADALYYLRVCLNGVMLDELRIYSRLSREPSPKSVVARESKSNEDDSSHEVWSVINRRLSNARERRLAYLLFYCALKPGEIVYNCPKEFSDVREVSRMRRDIMELISQ